ncbi:cerebellin 18 [Antennarius striatus]|uniref:cerebellin 18 n=1 Tax=Antennarius striatus TaxID=241820 RepID=UPI0035AE9756
MVVLPVLFLLGSVFVCGCATETPTIADNLREAAISYNGDLTCQKWDCKCAFERERSCCCAVGDMTTLENQTYMKMKYLMRDIKKLSTGVQQLTDRIKVAFKATMDPTLTANCFGPFNRNVPIPYTNVTLNDGLRYNPSLGTFTAPYSGIYAFSFTVYSHVDKNERLHHKVQLMKNGEPIAGVWEDNREDSQDSGSQFVQQQMDQGDQVYVELTFGKKICDLYRSNSFTGYIVFYD